jgi:uncharacterized membrane protein YkgB
VPTTARKTSNLCPLASSGIKTLPLFIRLHQGVLGAAGSAATFIMTVTIIPFMPDGWDPVAGFPAMTGNVPFLMKDVVLLAASIYLLKQDVERLGWL